MTNTVIKTITLVFASSLFNCSERNTTNPISNVIVDKPTLFLEGLVSTDADEFDIAFTKKSDSLFFTRRQKGGKQQIYISSFKKNTWSPPKLVPFSTSRDEFPTLSKDGKTVYFGSTRPIKGRISKGNFDMNLWAVSKNEDGWGTPTALGKNINQLQNLEEEWPSSNENMIHDMGNSQFLFSTMKRGDSIIHIYSTQLMDSIFSQPIKIDGLFEPDVNWKSSPTVTPDGKFLLFNAYDAPNGYGGEDIYVSKILPNGYSKAVNLGAFINTNGEEACPKFTADGQYFFFARQDKASQDAQGDWNIYYVETIFLNLESLFTNP